MRKHFYVGSRILPVITILSLSISICQAQKVRKLDWANDTISVADLKAARESYLNTVRGPGRNATEQINIPVDKLKDVMDACAENGIEEVAVYIISLRQNDLARYRRMNPETTATDDQLRGSQMLVFRIPRQAFASELSSKAKSPVNNRLMVSLLAMGLRVIDLPYSDLPAAEKSVFVTFGKICPPPATCN